jgi:hypothetical protein
MSSSRKRTAVDGAIGKYIQFHQHDPHRIGEFHRDLAIPRTVICAGEAVNVLYRSDKLNPTTGEDEGWIDYIHDHKDGVMAYRCDRQARGPEVEVPSWIRNERALYWLGDCLGFAFRGPDGREGEAQGADPLPELYAIESGRALLVIQGKRRVLALIWGGSLGVEPRGIVN